MAKYYPVAKHYITDEEIAAVTGVLKSNFLSRGPVGQEFEKIFAEKIGAKYAVATSSGTTGLHLAMLAANIGPGDEVITTPFTFIASGNCIIFCGAKPVFADIDPKTFNIDPKKIEEKITPRTKAILVVHIFGQAADMDPIIEIAKKHNLIIIEDACEATTAKYKGQSVGTFGESAVFAFFPNKQMTTGEGGMIVTSDQKKYELFMSLRNHGLKFDPSEQDYTRLGYNYRMNEMSAALGLTQFKKIDWLIQKKREIAALYNKFLGPHTDLLETPFTPGHNTHSWMSYAIKIKNLNTDQSPVVEQLEQRGINTKPYFNSLHLFPLYRDRFGYKEGDFPISEAISKSVLTLPFYIGLEEEDIKYITGELISILKELKS